MLMSGDQIDVVRRFLIDDPQDQPST